MVDEAVLVADTVEARLICGFWKRIFAYLIDSLVLAAVGLMLGLTLFDFLSRLGPWGILLGFSIAMVYFMPLNSYLGKGQTLGKWLMKIQVVDKYGNHISLLRSFLRYSVIALPFFLNNAMLPPSFAASSLWGNLIGLIVFGGGLAIVYLYIFNRRTRQSLHDLVVGTYVIRAPAPINPDFQNVWKGHMVVVGVWLVLVLVGFIALKGLGEKAFFKELLEVQMKIQDGGRVHTSMVFSGISRQVNFKPEEKKGHPGSAKYLSVTAICRESCEHAEGLANEIAEIVLDSYPRIMENDFMTINVKHGFDIGIARLWKVENFKHPPDEWADKLKRSI